MPVDSLLDMARRACTRYSARISDIGDLRYDLIRPILLKVESPEKLHQLEQNSPQIIGKNGEIWLNFIKRDIPDWESKPHQPKDPKNWWKVYRKLKQEAQKEVSAGEDKLKAALANIQNAKNQNVAQLVSRKELPRPGGVSRRQNITYNYISGKTGSKGANKMSLMEKIRKETRDAKSARLSRPTHALPKKESLVTRAPQRFLQDLKSTGTSAPSSHSRPPVTNPIRPPRPPLLLARSKVPASASTYDVTQDREARLRSLQDGKQETGLLSANFLEDFDDDDDDDRNGEETVSSSRPDHHRAMLNDSPQKQRTASPMRISSPPVAGVKRKAAPSLFMSTPKKIVQRSGVS